MSHRKAEQIQDHISFLHECRTSFDTEIAEHPSMESTKDFLITIESLMVAINGYYSQQHLHINIIEADLHYVWHMVIEVAKITGPEDITHDRLLILLLRFRELGTLRRQTGGVEEEAVIGNETRIWTDLPHFGSDLLAAWPKMAETTLNQRCNLAAFTGKCVALGVGGMDNILSAVWLLNKALERKAEVPLSKDSGLQQLVDLLPACSVLLQNCGSKLLTLCINSFTLGHGDPGSFSLDTKCESAVLSMEKWLSWRKNFQDLSQHEDGTVANEAKLCFDNIINCGREMGYVVEGEGQYWEKAMKLLSEELKKSGKESVGLEDILTNPQWANGCL